MNKPVVGHLGVGLMLGLGLVAQGARAQPEDESEPAAADAVEAGSEEPASADGHGEGGREAEPEPASPEPPAVEREPESASDAAPAEGTRAAREQAGPAKAERAARAGSPPEPEGKPKPAEPHVGRFAFGSYGRVIAAGDASGRPGRDADVVAHGSRLDLSNYVELELRREDEWKKVGAETMLVATLALGHPIFHYDGEFDAQLAVRNLYLQERDLGLSGLSVWAGSRMLRGDDIYLLDYWPLDNLNTIGGGVRYDVCGEPDSGSVKADVPTAADESPKQSEPEPAKARRPPWCTAVSLHAGLGQPNNPFYRQSVERPAPLNQFGAATVAVLDRQRWVGSLRAEQHVRVGGTGGLKFVAYGELHSVPSAERETAQAEVYEQVPSDGGFVVGGQVGGYTGARDTHINLFVRYASGLAAYGEFANPQGLADDRTADGAHEFVVATGGNVEFGPAAVMLGGYFRSFRNANGLLDFGDVDEGIVVVRPLLFFVDWAGVGVEASYQAQHRGVLAHPLDQAGRSAAGEPTPLTAHIPRLGVIPFLAPAGRGSFSRPWIYFAYVVSYRDEGARLLYPQDDVFRVREVDHYFGFGAEWWFGSTSYGGL